MVFLTDLCITEDWKQVEGVNKIINRFALLVAVLTFVLCTMFGISFFTSLIRSLIVYLGILFTFFVAGHTLKWGIVLTEKKPEPEDTK